MPNILGLVTTLLLFIILGSAQQRDSRQGRCEAQTDPCASASSQGDMNLCYGEQYSKADARLNTMYSKLLESFAAGPSKYQKQNESIHKLKAAERVWLSYRNLHCEAARDQYEGGSIAPTVWAICMATVTQHRIEELKAAYEDPDRKLE